MQCGGKKPSKKNTDKRVELIQRLLAGENVIDQIVNENGPEPITGMFIGDECGYTYYGIDQKKKTHLFTDEEIDDGKPYLAHIHRGQMFNMENGRNFVHLLAPI